MNPSITATATGGRLSSAGDEVELVVEYVKRRGALRVQVAGSGGATCELALVELLEHLNVDIAALPARRRYLLFAGVHDTGGGLGDLVEVFADEAAARAAFATLRLRPGRRVEWAELATVEARGSIRVLCWFGHDRPVPHEARSCGAHDTGLLPPRVRRARLSGRRLAVAAAMSLPVAAVVGIALAR